MSKALSLLHAIVSTISPNMIGYQALVLFRKASLVFVARIHRALNPCYNRKTFVFLVSRNEGHLRKPGPGRDECLVPEVPLPLVYQVFQVFVPGSTDPVEEGKIPVEG